MEAEETDLLPRLAFFPQNLEAGRRPQPDLLGSSVGARACRRSGRRDWLPPQRAVASRWKRQSFSFVGGAKRWANLALGPSP